ncbi:hypothetical protein HWB90_gp053 [Mycobacterium phage Fowlmouth]|uniref:Uncharacterized protein n=2 Tax=Fowlmouthvirus fowlmouth TaxID=2845652 RepID=A0A7G8LPU4_9CAUD|nr:hypothetical protein HWB90_gp053 [Mycobacterium phage Fowlmouth]AYN58003.1 hypothetical protein SEA_FOWLMOUTH_53 [Mycobacterium phage Fowlmouth]QNJ59266.1 hypothetical protein SEA_MRMIYAGI_52 [Mycobacterium phage MrMiyagi]
MMETGQQSTYVRILKVGQVFWDEELLWEVTREPVIENDSRVLIYIRPYPHQEGQRSRAFYYDHDRRVRLA